MPAVRPAIAALAAVAVAGCMVGPDFQTPTPPVAGQFLEAGNPSVRTDRQQYENWWTVFDDPALNRLIALAYAQNFSLQGAGARVLEARAMLGVAIGEAYPQQQSLNAGLAYQQLSHSDPTISQGVNLPRPSFDFWRASLSAQIAWELDFWGKFRRGIEAADAAYLASIASYDDVLLTLLGDVATAYTGVRTLQARIEVAKRNVVRQKKALAIARDRVAGGVATADRKSVV
jgi:outer membrane protein TolC